MKEGNRAGHEASYYHNIIFIIKTHCWDDGTPLEETMKALNDLVQSGKIHYVGVSNVTGWQFQRIIDLCREKGYNQIVSNQVRFKMYDCMHCSMLPSFMCL